MIRVDVQLVSNQLVFEWAGEIIRLNPATGIQNWLQSKGWAVFRHDTTGTVKTIVSLKEGSDAVLLRLFNVKFVAVRNGSVRHELSWPVPPQRPPNPRWIVIEKGEITFWRVREGEKEKFQETEEEEARYAAIE